MSNKNAASESQFVRLDNHRVLFTPAITKQRKEPFHVRLLDYLSYTGMALESLFMWVVLTYLAVALFILSAAITLAVFAPRTWPGYLAVAVITGVLGCIAGFILSASQHLAVRHWMGWDLIGGEGGGSTKGGGVALMLGSCVGWWVYSIWGQTPGVLVGVAIFGTVLGAFQAPFVSQIVPAPALWVPANTIIALLALGSIALPYWQSKGTADNTLLFLVIGLAYAVLRGLTLLFLTRFGRLTKAQEERNDREYAEKYAERMSMRNSQLQEEIARRQVRSTQANVKGEAVAQNTPGREAHAHASYTQYGEGTPPAEAKVYEVHEHHVYTVYGVDNMDGVDVDGVDDGSQGYPAGEEYSKETPNGGAGETSSRNSGKASVIDGTFRVIS